MMCRKDQIKMYNSTEEGLVAAKPSFCTTTTDLIMYAQGIVSDAQEVLAMGDAELSRQYMNRAKFWMHEAGVKSRKQELGI